MSVWYIHYSSIKPFKKLYEASKQSNFLMEGVQRVDSSWHNEGRRASEGIAYGDNVSNQ